MSCFSLHRLGLLTAILAVSGGCMTERSMRHPMPAQLRDARLIDIDQIEEPYAPVDPQMITALKESLQRTCELQHNGRNDQQPPINILALSGGGMYGAFDVGVLKGWTESGRRPEFDVVTGVSTGAFICTYAFLGPAYDEKLRQLYVGARPKDIFKKRPWISVLTADAVASSAPLKKKIHEAITPELLQLVAAEHAKGRRLYVGTTNLDTRRFVVWDMGAIASSNRPDALDLYRKIVLASGSIPGFFPPVLIEVEVNGKKYEELHVDGGTTASVFVPMSLSKGDPSKPCFRPGSHVYVISSGKLYPDSTTVNPRFAKITFDAISATLHAEARNDIFRIFNQAILCGMDFHLLAVPQKHRLNPNPLSFEAKELQELYEVGVEKGRNEDGWRQTPPGSELDEQMLPRLGTQFRTAKNIEPVPE